MASPAAVPTAYPRDPRNTDAGSRWGHPRADAMAAAVPGPPTAALLAMMAISGGIFRAAAPEKTTAMCTASCSAMSAATGAAPGSAGARVRV